MTLPAKERARIQETEYSTQKLQRRADELEDIIENYDG